MQNEQDKWQKWQSLQVRNKQQIACLNCKRVFCTASDLLAILVEQECCWAALRRREKALEWFQIREQRQGGDWIRYGMRTAHCRDCGLVVGEWWQVSEPHSWWIAGHVLLDAGRLQPQQLFTAIKQGSMGQMKPFVEVNEEEEQLIQF